MTDFNSWLDGIPLFYAPVSPPYIGPDFGGIPTEQITPLNIDEERNLYFDLFGTTQQVTEEPLPIDPSLTITPGSAAVMLPEHLAEDGSKLIIHLLRVLEIPRDDEAPNDDPTENDDPMENDDPAENDDLTENENVEMTSTEEFEALELIPEEDFESIPNTINGIRVKRHPHPADIKDVIDFRRVGLDRRSFYLAKSASGNYYWFCSSYMERNLQLGRLIGEYRRRSQSADGRRARGVKKLRSGRTIRVKLSWKELDTLSGTAS